MALENAGIGESGSGTAFLRRYRSEIKPQDKGSTAPKGAFRRLETV